MNSFVDRLCLYYTVGMKGGTKKTLHEVGEVEEDEKKYNLFIIALSCECVGYANIKTPNNALNITILLFGTDL